VLVLDVWSDLGYGNALLTDVCSGLEMGFSDYWCLGRVVTCFLGCLALV
jgi:hypothetical protein